MGGLPTLGGMFRSGDPATIPPHKFHLLVNMRRTPAGMVTRPGLTLVFNTGVEECINGLTEDAGEQGGAIMLYPGADPASNAATFRAIFPESSIDYSEFAFALYGPASVVRGTASPVLAYSTGGAYLGPPWLSRPFIFRGQAVQFATVDRSGTQTVALLGIELAARSFLQASDCFRTALGPALTPACPGVAGQATPPTNDPPLWPYQHPVGSVGVLAYFTNPFTATTAWDIDEFPGITYPPIDMILTMPERGDDALTGTPGVSEILYFIAVQNDAGTIKRKLVRWDGVLQSTELVTIPDDLQVAIMAQTYGPILGSAAADASAGDWGAVRGEAGTWTVIGGAGWTPIGAAIGDYSPTPAFTPRGLSWGGKGHLLSSGRWVSAAFVSSPFIYCHPQGATEFLALRGSRSCTPYQGSSDDDDMAPVDAVVVGQFCYVLGFSAATKDFLCVGDFTSPLAHVVAPVQLSSASSSPSQIWIQAVGGRVYVGGKFEDWNPETGAADDPHHGVYDVTDPTAIFNVYRVTESEQTNDAVGERYSRGALPAVPNDETGGQGFQAS